MDDHWKFYKKVNDDKQVSKVLFDRLFDWYYLKKKKPEEESMTVNINPEKPPQMPA